MTYDFDRVIDRTHNHAAKYDECRRVFGTDAVLPLWIADMDFQTAQPVIDALERRAAEGIWGYTSRPESYFAAVRDWQSRRKGWTPDVARMSHCLGVVQALSAIVYNFTAQEDAVLFLTPVYPEFYDVTEAWDRQVLESRMTLQDGAWRVDWADLEQKMSRARLFIFCSPHNPLGLVWSAEEITRVAALCRKYGVLMVSDEIHSDLIFHGKKFIPAATVAPEVITCISATKTFNLAGLQAAVVVFPDGEKQARFDAFWRKMDIHRNNAFSLTAVETAFREGEEWLEQLLPYISDNFDFVRDYCARYIPAVKPNLPDATYLMWLDCRALGLSDDALRDFMIQKAHLGLNEGRNFCRSLSGFMRLNVACPRSVLRTAMEQLRTAVDGL